MRLLFSLFFVHVLVRHIGGEAGCGGWGVMTSMHVHANATFVSLSCVHVLVRYIGGEGGWAGEWGGVGGDDVHANATSVFCFFFHLVLISSGAVHM